LELIAVDDRSTDNSLEILQGYARKYPEIMRVFTHPGGQHLGISATINLTLEKARGVYWCAHASDDVSYLDRVERQVAFLESRPDVGWIYGVADSINGDGTPLPGKFGCDLSSFPELAEALVFRNMIYGQTVMVRTKYAIELGGHEPGLLYGDWEFWVRLAARHPAAFLPKPVAAYRLHEYNTSPGAPSREQLKRGLDVMTTLRRKADTAEGLLSQARMKALLDFCRAGYLFALRDGKGARSAFKSMFESDPSLRHDPKQLAQWLREHRGLPLALGMVRELGIRPFWLANPAFMSALLRVGLYWPLLAGMRAVLSAITRSLAQP
jgi:glycosyltransferase involved in cell wall biosynthesis